MELPEKQGLKLCQRIIQHQRFGLSCSGTSRKTRIETRNKDAHYILVILVAVELPEKQGLKLN